MGLVVFFFSFLIGATLTRIKHGVQGPHVVAELYTDE